MFASKARCGPTPLRSNRLGVGPTYLHKRGHSLLCFCRCDGSAVSGLRSLSRLWEGGSFALCARGWGVRLQGSLRPDTAPLGFWVGSAVSGLRSLSRLWGGWAFALCARRLRCSPPRLAAARHRSASAQVSRRWRCFLVQCRKVGWIIDVRYGMKRTPNKGVIVPSYELGSESRTPNTHSAAIGSPSS